VPRCTAYQHIKVATYKELVPCTAAFGVEHARCRHPRYDQQIVRLSRQKLTQLGQGGLWLILVASWRKQRTLANTIGKQRCSVWRIVQPVSRLYFRLVARKRVRDAQFTTFQDGRKKPCTNLVSGRNVQDACHGWLALDRECDFCLLPL